MNTDNDFQIGKDHLTCQDYALSWATETEAVTILCDGCSSSPDVDIGARMLALAARETYRKHNFKMLGYQLFGEETIEATRQIFDLYPSLSPQALDATLLITQVKENEVNAFIYGDGVFFHKSAAGLYAMKVELTSGAPDYLSYNLDPTRKKQYEEYSDADKEVKHLEIKDENGVGSFDYRPFAPVVISRPVQAGDVVAICSDGIGSFRRADDSNIPWLELAGEFIEYKNTAGIFVKRRLNAFKKKMVKEGWTHSDDISIAAIVV